MFSVSCCAKCLTLRTSILLFFVFSSLSVASETPPNLILTRGYVFSEGKVAGVGFKIGKDKVIQTMEESQAKIQWDKKAILLLSKAEIQYLHVDKTNTKESLDPNENINLQFMLLKGALIADNFEYLYTLNVEVNSKESSTALLEYDSKTGITELSLLKGKVEIKGIGQDFVVSLKAEEKVRFHSIMEDGNPSFDILLKGRKVARGKFGKIEKLSAKDHALFKEKSKILAYKPTTKEKLKAEYTCQNPYGQFQQCVWICKGNPPKEKKKCKLEKSDVNCVRKKCNANGDWADEFTLPKGGELPCKSPSSFVGECDY